ncbi:hypothetical protein [Croceimicrobium hydrocarbonivorans]|uniref:ABM domain-containing protein n=1 Tax=Croceimicrobium hydrocarbonivorans TaxID=2761580 RepID=A0A7H0VIT8_9FLAO|nr:hypothetical protein [Croceimicrobium hydrocarbonivorans]QNR25636.1 hypothetical protein H4K34_07280 [Croceimicrobium hydrocarbonivorans]
MSTKKLCLELVSCRFRDEVNAEQAQKALAQLNDFLKAQKGYRNRTYTEMEHPVYLDLVWWDSLDDAKEASERAMQSELCKEVFALMDLPNVAMEHYELVSDPH